MKYLTILSILACIGCQKKTDPTDLTPLQNQVAALQLTLNTYVTNFNALSTQESGLEQTVGQLTLTLSNLVDNYNALLTRIDADETVIYTLRNEMTSLTDQLASLNTANHNLELQQSIMEASIHSALTQLAILNGYTNIVAILDPCGDTPGIVDEVLLKLSDGRILASFSDNSAGKNTRFSILSNGTYSTTDNTNCIIHVDGGNVTW